MGKEKQSHRPNAQHTNSDSAQKQQEEQHQPSKKSAESQFLSRAISKCPPFP
jgi:hypothetical protein